MYEGTPTRVNSVFATFDVVADTAFRGRRSMVMGKLIQRPDLLFKTELLEWRIRFKMGEEKGIIKLHYKGINTQRERQTDKQRRIMFNAPSTY